VAVEIEVARLDCGKLGLREVYSQYSDTSVATLIDSIRKFIGIGILVLCAYHTVHGIAKTTLACENA